MSGSGVDARGADFDIQELAKIPDPLAAARPVTQALPSAEAALAAAGAGGPTRGALRARRVGAIVIGVAWLLAVQIFIGIRQDLPPYLIAAHVAVPALLGAIALAIALSPGPAGLGPTAKTIIGFGLAAPLAFVAAALCAPCLESGSGLANSAFFCGDFIMVLAVVPLAAMVWAQRKTFAAGAPWRSALLGAGVGFSTAGAQALHCEHSDGFHVLIGHGWPVLVLGIIGWVFVRRTVRVH